MKILILAALLFAVPATGSTPDAWAALEAKSAAACIKASGLARSRVLPTTVRFSDALGIDARLVTGTYRQPQMKGARGLMLCAYDRRSGRVETSDAAGWWTRR